MALGLMGSSLLLGRNPMDLGTRGSSLLGRNPTDLGPWNFFLIGRNCMAIGPFRVFLTKEKPYGPIAIGSCIVLESRESMALGPKVP